MRQLITSTEWVLYLRSLLPIFARLHHIKYTGPGLRWDSHHPTLTAACSLRGHLRCLFLDKEDQFLGAKYVQQLHTVASLQPYAESLEDESQAAAIADSWNSCPDKGPPEPFRPVDPEWARYTR